MTVDSDPIEDVPAINIDDESGAQMVMEYILNAGHRYIAILAIRSGRQGHFQEYVGTLGARMKGYLSALAQFGLKVDGRHVRLVECVCTEEGGKAGYETLWKSQRKPTAIVSMSDIIAIGAMKAAQADNIRIPDDLSIAGFDDIPLAGLVHPGLTTVSQPSIQKGKLAADILVKLLNVETEPKHHLLPTTLVVRGSVGTQK